jgi:hypothetical protein
VEGRLDCRDGGLKLQRQLMSGATRMPKAVFGSKSQHVIAIALARPELLCKLLWRHKVPEVRTRWVVSRLQELLQLVRVA